MIYPFGQDFDVTFYTWNNGQLLQNLPAQTIQVYLFSAMPTIEVAQSGSGALNSIAVSYTSGNVYFTVPAIDNPSTNNETTVYDYWLAINFYLENNEQLQTIIRAVQLQQVHLSDTTASVGVEDLKQIAPRISTYLDDDDLNAFIATAHQFVLDNLRNKGLQFNLIADLTKLKPLIIFKALEMAHASEIQTPNDKFTTLMEIYRKGYEEALNVLVLEYGLPPNTSTTTTAITPAGSLWVTR